MRATPPVPGEAPGEFIAPATGGVTTPSALALARSHRPAVVEHADSPRSASDGRASSPPADRAVAFIATTLARRPVIAQLATFGAIGVVSTAAWAALYLLLRGALSPT